MPGWNPSYLVVSLQNNILKDSLLLRLQDETLHDVMESAILVSRFCIILCFRKSGNDVD